jgi:hypothetical protein
MPTSPGCSLATRSGEPAARVGRYDRPVSFYDEVLRELFAAVGAALFFGNLVALVRRRADAQRVAAIGKRSKKAKGRSRIRSGRGATGELVQAPLARSVVYLVLGFVMMVAGIAALVAG